VKKLICYSQLSTAQFNVTNQNTLTLSPAAWRAYLRQPVCRTNCLVYGTLATARTFAPGDSLIFAQGALTAVLT
jgi:hypothetical protein